ncbi:MAG: hypothetical protein C0611_07930 [Desulfobacteraceae bacterium]|nr:MAG: hypothetical protein C0611_07930 [Desulfobacteraceae bacterium]
MNRRSEGEKVRRLEDEKERGIRSQRSEDRGRMGQDEGRGKMDERPKCSVVPHHSEAVFLLPSALSGLKPKAKRSFNLTPPQAYIPKSFGSGATYDDNNR